MMENANQRSWKSVFSGPARLLLYAQPYLALLVFLSVLTGFPPLWLAWTLALLPVLHHFVLEDRPFRRTPFDIPILLLTCAMLIGFFLSPDPAFRASGLNTYLACVAFYYGLTDNSKSPRAWWLFLAAFFGIIFLGLAVLVFATGLVKHTGFNLWAYHLGAQLHLPEAWAQHPNILGGIFSIAVPSLAGITLFPQRAWLRWAAGVMGLLFGLILFLSASGGGWIAGAIGLLTVLLARSRRAFLGAVLCLGFGIGVVLLWFRQSPWLGTVFPFQNLVGRVDLWKATLEAMKSHPLLGLGLGGWWSEVKAAEMTAGGPHSTYLQLWADCGLAGILALTAALFAGVKTSWRTIRSDKKSTYYGIAMGLVGGGFAAFVFAFLDNIFVVLAPLGEKSVLFTVPLLWLWAGSLAAAYERLTGGGGVSN